MLCELVQSGLRIFLYSHTTKTSSPERAFLRFRYTENRAKLEQSELNLEVI